MMKTLLVLLALVAVTTAVDTAANRNSLLKRLLDVLEQEKRSMDVFNYDGKILKVSFKVCVRGDKSRTPCKNRNGVKGHRLHVFDDNDKEVFTKAEDYMEGYGGPYGRYEMTMMKAGEHYEIWACESYPGEKPGQETEYECNKGDLIGGEPKFAFGGRVFNPIQNRIRNQNPIRS